jgi:hypothetical protein
MAYSVRGASARVVGLPDSLGGIASSFVQIGTRLCLLLELLRLQQPFFVGDVVELVGAAVLTAGMWLVGWVLWHHTRRRAADRTTRALLTISAAVLSATMLLALSWALGHVVDTSYLPLEWMVATHGVANTLGFALCGLLAFRRLGGLPR